MKKPHTFQWPDERISALRKVYEAGALSMEAISIDFKCSKDTINRLAGKYGWKRSHIPTGGRPLTRTTPARVAAIKTAYETGEASINEIAKEYRISSATIAKLANDCGWKKRAPSRFIKHNSYHKPTTITEDARERTDDPEVLRAKRILQPFFVVFGKGPYMVGTHRLDRDALLEKARRYEAKGMGA